MLVLKSLKPPAGLESLFTSQYEKAFLVRLVCLRPDLQLPDCLTRFLLVSETESLYASSSHCGV